MPAPRRAIERALSAPHDYLNCECCEGGGKGDAAALSSSQPATAILYQLYLESGALINIADLWAAFSAVVGTEGEEEKGEAEKKDDDDDDEERKLSVQCSLGKSVADPTGYALTVVAGLCSTGRWRS